MGKFQVDQPRIIQAAAQKTAVIHIITPRENIRMVMGPGYDELMAAIARQGVKPIGTWFTHHLRMDPDIFDFEIGVPVPVTVTSDGWVIASEFPAGTVAKTIYHGDYEQLGETWAEFDKWIAQNGYDSAEDLFETYLIGPETTSDLAQWQTELNRPLAGSAKNTHSE